MCIIDIKNEPRITKKMYTKFEICDFKLCKMTDIIKAH